MLGAVLLSFAGCRGDPTGLAPQVATGQAPAAPPVPMGDRALAQCHHGRAANPLASLAVLAPAGAVSNSTDPRAHTGSVEMEGDGPPSSTDIFRRKRTPPDTKFWHTGSDGVRLNRLFDFL